MTNKENKIPILGSRYVGKSSLCKKFAWGIIVDPYDPTFEQTYKKKEFKVDEKQYNLQLINVNPSFVSEAMKDLHIKTADGIILIYSITNKSTYNDLEQIYEHIIEVRGSTNFPLIVVGNKCDLESERNVSQDEGKELAEKFNADFIEVSVRKEIRIDEIFTTLIKKIDQPKITSETNKGCSLL